MTRHRLPGRRLPGHRLPGRRPPGRRRGIALPVIMTVLFILSAFVFALFRYQSHRVWVTGASVNDTTALAAAEAGISCVMAEIQAAPRFATHEIVRLNDDGSVEWGPAVTWNKTLPDGPGLTLGPAQGAYQGTVGADPYAAEFKVRVGYLPDLGAGSTTAGGGEQENKYLYMEALGKRADPGKRQDRFTRVRLMVERENYTEFLIYDGGYVTLGMGSKQDPDGFNVFADGRIYGEDWVHLGDIAEGGTKQKFVNITSIRSANEIRASSSYDIYFQAPRGVDGQPSGGQGFFATLNPSNDSSAGEGRERANGRIMAGEGLPPPDLNLQKYGTIPGTLLVDKPPVTKVWDSYPELDDLEVVELDFGRARYGPGPGDDGLPEGLGQPYPDGFNGAIFVPAHAVVRGAPDRDVTIVAQGHIFVAGDFNQRENFAQDYRPNFISEVSGEDDTNARVADSPYYTYVEPERFLEPGGAGARLPPEQSDRRACALMATGRIWRDYRLPGTVMRNELLGLMALELGQHVAALGVVTANADPEEFSRAFVAAQDPGTLNYAIPNFSRSGGAVDPDTQIPRLHQGLEAFDSLFPWTLADADPDGDDEYRRGQPRIGPVYDEPESYEEFIDAASKRELPAYLVPGRWEESAGMGRKVLVQYPVWYVSKEAKAKIHELVNTAFQDGQMSYQRLWGDAGVAPLNTQQPNQEPGVLWKIYDVLLEDEARWKEFKGAGFIVGGNRVPPEQTTRLALGQAPMRLYNLVRDEEGVDLLDWVGRDRDDPPVAGPGVYADNKGQNPAMQADRLYYPQQTINAMLFTTAKKNDDNTPGGDYDGDMSKERDPTQVGRRFHELGNARTQGMRYLGLVVSRNGEGGGANIITPLIQRIRGSTIDFNRSPALEPQMNWRGYYPPIRRRIFDPALSLFPPPVVPFTARVLSWFQLGARAQEYEGF